MNSAGILLTAGKADCLHFLNRTQRIEDLFLHLPLERYEAYPDEDVAGVVAETLNEFVFVVHGNLRNARYFFQWAQDHDLIKDCKNRIHLVSDPATSSLLEDYNLPAIMPREFAKGIDIIEFMLRISKDGDVLYPTSDSHTEEIPGLLKELEMPVMEFTVCRERTLSERELEDVRQKIKDSPPETILFHNRSSVKRIKLAFPDLDLLKTRNIAADQGVAEFMEKEEIVVSETANGTWLSLSELLLNRYGK